MLYADTRGGNGMSSQEERIASAAEEYFRNQARQAGWVNDPAGWAKDVLGVHLWSKQREICDSVRTNKRTVVASCHGTGKALALDEVVHTPESPVPMGDLKPGMKVLGSDGSPVEIVATTGHHRASSYRIRLERGGVTEEIVASGDHLWPILDLRTFAEIQLKSDRAGVFMETGLWHHKARIVSTRKLASMRGIRVIPSRIPDLIPRGATWSADDSLSDLFRERGCLDPLGRTALKWQTRRDSLPSEVEEVRDRLHSLGVHTILRSDHRNSSSTRHLAVMGTHAPHALPHPDSRAIARAHLLTRQGSWGDEGWRVLSVTPIGERDVQCIEVDAPDHLYLCGESGIPTHNSMIASVIACWWVATKPPGQAIVVSCYTDDTEVLTKDGWKLFKDVRTGPDGDEFATRNPETKQFEWQHAFRYYEAPWDGEVVDVTGHSLDLRVTPNHRMVVQWPTYKDGVKTIGETFKRADEIGPRGAELPALSRWEGKTPEAVTFGRYTWDAEDFAAFLGAYLAEGSLGSTRTYTKKGGYAGSVAGDKSTCGGPIHLTQLPGTKGYEPYRDLLTRMLGCEPARSGDKSWVFTCSELYSYLKNLGRSHEKHIPQEVKDWGPSALKKLLEFYLLGDGWFQKSQGKRGAEGYESWRSYTVSKRLADDLQEVAQKVGRHATITVREPRDGGIFEGGRRILKENCRTGYYVIFGDCQTERIKATRSHYKGNVYCVSVPNETLYVRRGGAPIWCANTAPTYAQVNKILWEEIRKHHATASRGKYPMPGRVTQADEWKLNDGQIVGFGRKPAKGDRHSFHGIHRRYVLALIDEACGVPEEIWTGIEAITTNVGCRILAIGNPDDRNTEFGKNFLDPRTEHMWNRISIPARVTPNFTGEPVPKLLNEVLISQGWVADRLSDWGEKDPRYMSKVDATFPKESQSSLFAPSLIADARDEPPQPAMHSVLRLGVDVARFGSDKTVVASYSGNTVRIEDSWSGIDTVSSAHKVLDLAERLKEERKAPWVEIRVDGVGLGAGVVDTLNARSVLLAEPWFTVYEMHGSAAPPANVGGSVYGYGNARAYWFDQVRQRMRNGLVKLDDPELSMSDDFAMIFYKIVNSRLFIISKEDMRAQYGRSPDLADAVAYAVAPVADGLQQGDVIAETAEDFVEGLDDDLFDENAIAPF